jgi:heat shock protein beta
MKTILDYFILLSITSLIILPVFFWMVIGEKEFQDQKAPTPEPELRANEKVGLKTDDEVISREEEKINPNGFSVKERKLLEQYAEKHQFQTEVNQLMKILIESLYSNKDVFLRELISNASDALNKIRLLSLTDPKQLDLESKLHIKIKADPENKTLHIIDTGIGMTKEDFKNNLGTIAKSGTTEFLQRYKTSKDSNLIGQFGVGFYSAFLVSDTVTVISKHNNDKQHVWQSDAHGTFSIGEDPRGNTLKRGTEIILHIKEDSDEYLDQDKLRNLVKKYSEFIDFPIYLWSSYEEEKEVPITEGEKTEEEEKVNLDEETKEEKEVKTKTITETKWEWELMNEIKPIWTRNPKDITPEEYNAFYKSFVKSDESDPLTYIHFTAEGEVDFKSILFIPSDPPKNMFDPSVIEQLSRGIKLYVRRVFITDEFKDLLPRCLQFLKGIVDSDDLPLNVSREMLQEHKMLKLIKKKLIRKAIAMIQTLAEDKQKYLDFWKKYGTNIKLGVLEDINNRVRLSKLLMFYSSKTGELTTLDEYLSRMKEGQKQIYYLAGENKESVETSPLIEKLVTKGYEVLYMLEPVDEYTMQALEKYDGKYKLTNIAREGLEFDDDQSEKTEKENKEKFSGLIKYLKKVLSSRVERVEISKRLTHSPSALVSSQYGWTANMERILKAQALSDPNANKFQPARKILEINPKHPIIVELKNKIEKDENDPDAEDIAELLYETACLTSGYSLDEPSEFAQRIVRLMNKNLNIDPNFHYEEVEGERKDEL